MFIPIRTDRLPKRRPVVVEAIIALNVMVFVAGLVGANAGWFSIDDFLAAGQLDPTAFRVHNLVTYQFMHDPEGIWHVALNMLFLWVFGQAVESRLRRFGFLSFYLLSGAVAGLAHMMVSDAPVIGASGAVCAVAGAFLALFPRSNTVVLFLFTLSFISISSLWFIGLYVAIDFLRQVSDFMGRSMGRTAYMAHLAGYVYGFAYAFSLLGLNVLKRDEFDAFYLFKQMRRRAAMRAAMREQQGKVWQVPAKQTAARQAQPAEKLIETRPEPPTKVAALRARVNQSLDSHDVKAAAVTYRELIAESPEAVFNEQRQLDIANQLLSEGDHATAAIAYELLLRSYPGTSHAGQVRLMLGLTYARHLKNPDKARETLTVAMESTNDPGQKALAAQLLAELPAAPAKSA